VYICVYSIRIRLISACVAYSNLKHTIKRINVKNLLYDIAITITVVKAIVKSYTDMLYNVRFQARAMFSNIAE